MAAAVSGDKPAPGAPVVRKPTRKRMIDAMLREAERRKALGLPPAPPPPPPPRKGKRDGKPRPKQPPAAAAPAAEDEEVLDLSAFMVGGAGEEAPEQDEEGTADSFGGFDDEDDEEGGFLEDADGDDFMTPASTPEAGAAPAAGKGQTLLNTWQFDSDVGEVVFKQIVQRKPRPSAAASAAGLEAMLARLERDAAEDDEDDSEVFDASERGVDEELRVPTKLQKVDSADVDEVIDALSGLNTMFLDKESQALLDEELSRKKKVRQRARLRKPYSLGARFTQCAAPCCRSARSSSAAWRTRPTSRRRAGARRTGSCRSSQARCAHCSGRSHVRAHSTASHAHALAHARRRKTTSCGRRRI